MRNKIPIGIFLFIIISFILWGLSRLISSYLPCFVGDKSQLDILAVLTQVALVAVGILYAYETYRIRVQNNKQYFKEKQPVLCLRYSDELKIEDVGEGNFKIKNITGNPALSVSCIYTTGKGDGIQFSMGKQDYYMSSIAGGGKLSVKGFNFAECEKIKADVIKNYDEKVFAWIQNPEPLFPSDKTEYARIFFLYRDLRKNSYITQRDLPFCENQHGDVQPELSNLGREQYFPPAAVRKRWEGKKKKWFHLCQNLK